MAAPKRIADLSLPSRAWIFFIYVALAYGGYSYLVVGGFWRPTGGGADLWFLSVVGLAAVRLIESPFFRKPSDSLLAALTSGFVLWAVDPVGTEPLPLLNWIRWVGVAYAVVIAGISVISIGLLRSERQRPYARRLFYRISTRLGSPELLFTPTVFISLIGFHDLLTADGAGLAAVWFLIAVSRPIEELVKLTILKPRATASRDDRVGVVVRIDAPNLVRVAVDRQELWDQKAVFAATLPSGSHVLVLPLFLQMQGDGVLGTALACGPVDLDVAMPAGTVFSHPECPRRDTVVADILGEAELSSKLAGFVVEGSNINQIQFEVALENGLREGLVVFCVVGGRRVYYQILGARTEEEVFNKNPRGTLVVAAAQLGVPDDERGFSWHPWVPGMNSPVFQPVDPPRLPAAGTNRDRLEIGQVPGTQFPAQVDFRKLSEFHAAVLGVTGMGKTELVFELVREGFRREAKILCVDFTGEYGARLSDLNPIELGLSDDRIDELENLVDAVEMGEYSAADEKRRLMRFLKRVHPEIAGNVTEFLETDRAGLAIFELEDIANTRATLRATELYLSEIFRWAKENRRAREILLVLEEAHTIIPEFNLFGFDRSDTAAVVGRMSQIALQGRKYGVGILLVSQRTALVSKTVLSQCNSYFCFSLVDKTSLEYMANVFGTEHLSVIPNLRARQLVAYGPGVLSEKPMIVEIPFDEQKARASAQLDRTIEPEPREEVNSTLKELSGEAPEQDSEESDDSEMPF